MARDASQLPGTTPADARETTHGGLTIERYGELSAHLRRFPRFAKTEVLARLTIADADWDAAVCGWTDALAEESADGGEALSNRFCRAFTAAETRLEREQPTLASLGPWPTNAPPDVSPPAPPALAVVPAGMRHFTSLRETVETAPTASRGPALPFAPRTAAGPGGLNERAASFAESAARAAAPPPRSAFPPGGHTADLSTAVASALGQRNPLPFNAAPKGAALPAEVRPGSPAAPVKHGSESGATRPAAAAAAPGSAHPGDSRGAARAAASQPLSTASAAVLSLEQHASMCAEIAVAPGKTAEIVARYGLTEATRAQTDEHWRARIAQESRAGEAWQRAYTIHRDRLLGLRS
ncbi:hypothetical protein [Sorangium cellulosum]|uniref:Uncharacterized protein n=1 Tax=Sorangium cellulosum TaxID=56 RepID=A0A150Q288_SORCE|nr:hypothetical protein [Sorangium cellulosum]KYF62084.1 hypothetical protein BE15_24690 [Sorangium cellulosum]